MLEAMQERQTSIAGVIHPLPTPFMVLATQNPIEEEGTYLLPQAQMDRFLLKEVVEYPRDHEELEVLNRFDSGALGTGSTVASVVTLEPVGWLQRLVDPVYVDPVRSYEHTSELQSLMRISYAVLCLKIKKLN